MADIVEEALLLLKSIIIIIWKRLSGCGNEISLVPLLLSNVNVNLRGSKSRRLNKVKVLVPRKLPSEVQEGLLKVVVTLRGDLVVLKILLPVERHLLSLHLPVLHIDLVPAENDGDVLTHTAEVTVPRGDVLVCEPRCHVEHDHRTLTMDAAIEKTKKEIRFFIKPNQP